MIKTEQLYYLEQVAKYHSLTLAANELYLIKAALSTSLKQLEKECGFDILQRTYRGVKLTVKGERVLEYARQVLQILEEISTLRYIEEQPSFLIRKDLYIERSLVPLLQKKLLVASSGVINEYVLHEVENFAAIKKELNSGNLALVALQTSELEALKKEGIFIVITLFDSKYYPASKKGTKWISDDIGVLTPEEFQKLPKISLNRQAAQFQWENVVLETSMGNTFVNAIVNDLGIGLLTDFGGDIFLENHKLLKLYKPLDDNMIYITVILHNSGNLTRAATLEKALQDAIIK